MIILKNNTDLYGFYCRYKNLRDAAWQTLIDFKVSSLPVSLLAICTEAGISIIENKHVNELRQGESGVSVKQNDKWYIIIEDTEILQRQRFTIAHELAHIFLGHKMYSGYYTRRENMVKSDDETEADMFAARLLAPACVLWGINAQTAEQIASVCNISHEAAKIRAERMEALRKRGKFLLSPLERQVYQQFESYIKNNRLK